MRNLFFKIAASVLLAGCNNYLDNLSPEEKYVQCEERMEEVIKSNICEILEIDFTAKSNDVDSLYLSCLSNENKTIQQILGTSTYMFLPEYIPTGMCTKNQLIKLENPKAYYSHITLEDLPCIDTVNRWRECRWLFHR